MSGGAARAAVLARVRSALADVPAGEPGAAVPAVPAAAAPDDLAGLFADRVADYRATVTRCAADDAAIAAAIGEAFARHGAGSSVVAPGVPEAWRAAAPGPEVDEPALALERLDAVDGVLSGCALGIAETGTIILDGARRSGRRAITLVPDLHVCVVLAADVVAGVAEATARLGAAIVAGRPVTLVSGPSATSDIELDRVEGVHGPRRLEVVLAG
ncbi:lactate utilization protein C [Baekduia soli]|uniref:Lactate utilization protein C n=1 Tax=Baekduia soli TaxID=496014 RepID=A0A5B8U4S6_9ACTN|nr:LUD domain-containing protein [Baekduia soli]QEC47652.1 lactate utilization protein C [Baekduia soli]